MRKCHKLPKWAKRRRQAVKRPHRPVWGRRPNSPQRAFKLDLFGPVFMHALGEGEAAEGEGLGG